MDVVKRNIEGLGGRVELNSAPGFGATVTIRLPLTLAILDGMSVAVGEENFIIPLTLIVESLKPRPEDIRSVTGEGQLIQVRGEYLPIIGVHDVFGAKPRSRAPSDGILVVVETDHGRVALWVDDLLGQQQVVIKSLESNYRKVAGISGATILGDGSVALILDVSAVVREGRGSGLKAAA
jgi:two-component system chemotaxis sensor kinase CheA